MESAFHWVALPYVGIDLSVIPGLWKLVGGVEK